MSNINNGEATFDIIKNDEKVRAYITAGNEALLLTNLSAHDISLLSVRAEGLEFEAPIAGRITLRPGETASLPCEAALPSRACHFDLTVAFVRKFPVPAREHRTFSFTALSPQEEHLPTLRFPGGEPSAAPPRPLSARALPIPRAKGNQKGHP